MTNRPLKVFLCHSSNDKPAVRELYQKLRAEPWIQPWLDEEELYPGQDWNMEIEKAVEAADAIIVCLTKGSITKEGYVQRELRIVLDFADYKPEGTLYIIPVRLEECEPPRRLRAWQYADYFPESKRERNVGRLLVSLKRRADSLGLEIGTSTPVDLVFKPSENAKKEQDWSKEWMPSDEVSDTAKEGLVKSLVDETKKIESKLAEEKKSVIGELRPGPYTRLAKQKSSNKLTLSNGMEFVRVPAGKFLMGSTKKSKLAFEDEHPQHTLDIPYDYWMGRYSVTNEQYNFFAESRRIEHPVFGWENKKDHPVVYINLNGTLEYLRWLNNMLKKELSSELVLRLPTEEEWEKASRGADGREYPWGNEFDKNKCNSSGSRKIDTTPVQLYSPHGDSPFGCSDMVGNVWEWTYSEYKKYPLDITRKEGETLNLCVVRGGSFMNVNKFVRCAARDAIDKNLLNDVIGFRICLAPPLPK